MLAARISSNPTRTHVVEVVGRLDADNAPALAQTIDALLDAGCQHLVLDMSAVQFMNSAGLRTLMQIFRRVDRLGGTLTVVNPAERVEQLLMLVGLDSVFDIVFDPAWNPASLGGNAPPRHVFVCD